MSYGYTLRATLVGTGAARWRFDADSDTQAIIEASFEVMERAVDDVIWSKGRVELSNDKGEVIQVMEAK